MSDLYSEMMDVVGECNRIIKRRKIVYISGKYTDNSREEIVKNIELAKEYAQKIWEMGYTAICPHLNSDFQSSEIAYADYLEGDIELIRRSNLIYMLPNWKNSPGAKVEHLESQRLNKPIIYDLGELL